LESIPVLPAYGFIVAPGASGQAPLAYYDEVRTPPQGSEITLRLPETQEVVLHFQDRLGKPVDARAVVADEEGVLLEPRAMLDLKNLVPADAPREFLVAEGKLVAHLPVGQYRLYCHAPDNPLEDVHVFDFDVGNGTPEWSFTVE